MKIGELKHNHSLTDLLKVLLFAILMLAPCLNVLTRCLYVTCNKNAYQSYSGYNIETNTELATKIESGLDYQLSFLSYSGTMQTDVPFEIENLNIATGYTSLNTFYNNYKDDIKYIRFAIASNVDRIYFYDETMTQLDQYSLGIGQSTFVSFTALSNANLSNNDLIYRVWQQQVGNSLDNVFEYSVSKLATDPMYSWTANTPVFTGIQAMSTQLGITAPAIPIIIAYWLILTCVYIVIDIVIKLITYLTHLIGARKGA